jgi:hypothetical protein
VRDAADLADLLRMGRLPEAYVAPPAVRELRELVRHRAKLVCWRSGLKASVHAVLAKQGLHIPVSDLFGLGGRQLLTKAPLEPPYRARVDACCRLIDAVDFEVDTVTTQIRAQLTGHTGYAAIQAIPGVGAILAAVFVAEIGQVDQRNASRLVGRARPETSRVRHHRAPRADHQTRLRPGAVGRRRGRPEDPGLRRLAGIAPGPHRRTARPQHRHRRGGPQAAHPRLLRPARRAHPRPPPSPTGGVSRFGRDRDRVVEWGSDTRQLTALPPL